MFVGINWIKAPLFLSVHCVRGWLLILVYFLAGLHHFSDFICCYYIFLGSCCFALPGKADIMFFLFLLSLQSVPALATFQHLSLFRKLIYNFHFCSCIYLAWFLLSRLSLCVCSLISFSVPFFWGVISLFSPVPDQSVFLFHPHSLLTTSEHPLVLPLLSASPWWHFQAPFPSMTLFRCSIQNLSTDFLHSSNPQSCKCSLWFPGQLLVGDTWILSPDSSAALPCSVN